MAGGDLSGGSGSSGSPTDDATAAGPYTDLSYARLLTSYEAYELAELARAAVPIGAHEQNPDGTPVTTGAVLADAVRVLTAAHRLVEAAVVYERVGGADWQRIASDLNSDLTLDPHTARERFATAEARFREQPPAPEGGALPEAPWWLALARTAPLEAALDLDDWVLRHEDGDGDGLDTAPVSRGLVRRDPRPPPRP